MRSIVRAKLRWTVFVSLVLLTGFAGIWIGRARQALNQAQAEIRDAGIAFKIRAVSDAKPTAVDSLPSPPDFRDAQLFHDRLYICGAGGIWVYNLAGELQTTYLVGRDLPPAPPVAMTVGTLAGDVEAKLWIGTGSAGVLASDGIRFSHIQVETKGYGNVTSVFMLPTGILLLGFSEGGVVAYDGTRMKPFHPNLRNIPVTALAGSEGDLWIGTRDRGVIHWRGSTTEEFQDESGLPDSRVLSITVADDRVFVGTPVGTAEFRDGKLLRTLGRRRVQPGSAWNR